MIKLKARRSRLRQIRLEFLHRFAVKQLHDAWCAFSILIEPFPETVYRCIDEDNASIINDSKEIVATYRCGCSDFLANAHGITRHVGNAKYVTRLQLGTKRVAVLYAQQLANTSLGNRLK